jgi:hypothetical protein
MSWEAALWVGLALGAPALGGWFWPRIAPRLGDWARPIGGLGPWCQGLLPAYLALVTGAVSGRDAGLYGRSGGEWLAALVACGVALMAAAMVLWWKPMKLELPLPLSGVLDEPRWALYRAAGVLWIGAWIPGVFVGLALCGLEWVAATQPWKQLSRSEGRSTGAGGKGAAWLSAGLWVLPLRMALSTALFLATRNLWVTAAAQAGLLALQGPRPTGFMGGEAIADGLPSPQEGGQLRDAGPSVGSGAGADKAEQGQAEEEARWINGS